MNQQNYIQVRNSQINYYKEVPLFYQSGTDSYALYKPPGTILQEMRINQQRHPRLYIHEEDRIVAIKELQKGFNKQIELSLTTGNVVNVKASLCDLVEETLEEPRSGTLKALPETVDSLITGYSKHPEILKSIASISFKDYTTVIHSVNVMALTLGFCFHSNFKIHKTRRIGLSALLHDIGKTEVPVSILKAPRKLSDHEFSLMKTHPTIGHVIIREKNRLGGDIALGALEHHEKLDGSGYPKGTRNISYVGQLLGLIDCYEALTNEDRPYRRARKPLETLKFLKDDVQAGKFNRDIFEKFCYSLI
ncbi:MAG: HD domain-containing phosphohydrolase [Desulfobacteraceae bacterium]|nr:HD domain-containing phosphohydrolase [Desulfobacteraceae bacterium]